jgi:hypothetical protein
MKRLQKQVTIFETINFSLGQEAAMQINIKRVSKYTTRAANMASQKYDQDHRNLQDSLRKSQLL